MENRIREGLEACRPGSDDLRSPELADVAAAVDGDREVRSVHQRLQNWDVAISNAMEDVPLPEGLAARVLARLSAEASVEDSQSPEQRLEAAPSTGAVNRAIELPESPLAASEPFSPRSRFSRRRLVSMGACSAIAAGLLVAVGLVLSHSPAELSLETLAEDWHKEVVARPAGWHAMHLAPPAGYAVPATILAAPVSWQPVGQFAKGVAYKLRHSKAGSAMLYVVRLARPGLPTAPPGQPQSTTGGQAVGYWRSGNVIYVLVVPGDERNYRAFIRSAPAPLA